MKKFASFLTESTKPLKPGAVVVTHPITKFDTEKTYLRGANGKWRVVMFGTKDDQAELGVEVNDSKVNVKQVLSDGVKQGAGIDHSVQLSALKPGAVITQAGKEFTLQSDGSWGKSASGKESIHWYHFDSKKVKIKKL
jgi:hypothetical protein